MKILRYVNICFFVFFQLVLFAVPANKKNFIKIQPDNSKLQICLIGDESFAWTETIDGVVLEENEEGFFTYAIIDAEGNIAASAFIAKEAGCRNSTENQFIVDQKNRKALLYKNRFNRNKIKRIQADNHFYFPSNNTMNKQKGLVILVEFADIRFSISEPLLEYTNQLNQPDYINQYGQKGSIRDYFSANSMGQFNPEFITIGPVRLKENRNTYGADRGMLIDVSIEKFVLETLNSATFDEIDLSELDSDNDGVIDFVYFIYAGHGQNYSGSPASTIWPHSFSLTGLQVASPVVQGLKFDDYACSSELSGATGMVMDGIGTFCHEFCHVLGLMDMYDTDYEGSGGDGFGLGEWSIMSSGSYNNNGYMPCNLNAFERTSLNWLSLTELYEEQVVELNDLATSNEGFIIRTKLYNEYFIIENRQPLKWDAALPSSGMLIYHIDYDPLKWNDNTINTNPNHPHVKILPADNELLKKETTNYNQYLLSLKGDPYPGSKNNTEWTDLSLPGSILWDGSLLSKSVTSIKDSEGLISFEFMRGIKNLSIPVVRSASEVSSTGFVANWVKVEDATNYLLDVYSEDILPAENNIIETEGFQLTNDVVCLVNSEWITTSVNGDLTLGNYGKEAPSLRLNQVGDFLRTPMIEGEIISFSFWGKSASLGKTDELTIKGYNGTEWVELHIIQLPKISSQVYKFNINVQKNLIPPGIKQIEIVVNKESNGILIDDIAIAYNRKKITKKIYVTPYRNFETGDVDSFVINGLSGSKTYNYTIRAMDGANISDVSEVVKVDLNLSSYSLLKDKMYNVSAIGSGKIRIDLNGNNATLPVRIIDSTGRIIYSDIISTNVKIFSLKKGLYIVDISGYRMKVIVT